MKLCSFRASYGRHLCHGRHVLLVPAITKHLPTPLQGVHHLLFLLQHSIQLSTKGMVTFSRTFLRATWRVSVHKRQIWCAKSQLVITLEAWSALEKKTLVHFSHHQFLGGKLFELSCPFLPGIRNCIIYGKTGVCYVHNELPTKISQWHPH